MTIEIPDELANELGADTSERIKHARELIALELYREGRISLRTMGHLAGAGADHWSADAFRVRHGMPVSGFTPDEADDLSAFTNP
ncbi:MAG: UPF0175 family protein [Chthoniobacterales bacterium]